MEGERRGNKSHAINQSINQSNRPARSANTVDRWSIPERRCDMEISTMFGRSVSRCLNGCTQLLNCVPASRGVQEWSGERGGWRGGMRDVRATITWRSGNIQRTLNNRPRERKKEKNNQNNLFQILTIPTKLVIKTPNSPSPPLQIQLTHRPPTAHRPHSSTCPSRTPQRVLNKKTPPQLNLNI